MYSVLGLDLLVNYIYSTQCTFQIYFLDFYIENQINIKS